MEKFYLGIAVEALHVLPAQVEQHPTGFVVTLALVILAGLLAKRAGWLTGGLPR